MVMNHDLTGPIVSPDSVEEFKYGTLFGYSEGRGKFHTRVLGEIDQTVYSKDFVDLGMISAFKNDNGEKKFRGYEEVARDARRIAYFERGLKGLVCIAGQGLSRLNDSDKAIIGNNNSDLCAPHSDGQYRIGVWTDLKHPFVKALYSEE